MSYLKNDDLPLLLHDRKPVIEPEWFTNDERFQLVMLQAQNGLLMKAYTKLDAATKDVVDRLEIHSYLQWENDKHGKKYILTLTWQGDDLATKLKRALK